MSPSAPAPSDGSAPDLFASLSDGERAIGQSVRQLYNTYPFPPEPLLDAPPPGYNWRWHWQAAHQFCTGRKPDRDDVRILDAGCGTGAGTEYLMHLNPRAQIVGIDLSEEALAVARERCRRTGSGAGGGAERVEFRHLSLYDAAELDGSFDLINCVGVLHHLPDPKRGLQALAAKLAPGGLLHIFIYAELGRWEIRLMQEALRLLRQTASEGENPYRDGVALGRAIFAALPETNRLARRERERWSLENQRDACFADMYVHPQEIDYNLHTTFDLIDSSGLEFVGFSNPHYWNLARLVGEAPEVMARAEGLGDRDRYRLIELLDPDLTHYEFFLARPPLDRRDWSRDEAFRAAVPELHPCTDGWPSRCLFDPDYQIVNLSEPEQEFLRYCAANGAIAAGTSPETLAGDFPSEPPAARLSVGEIGDRLARRSPPVPFDLAAARSLLDRNLLLLADS